MTIEAKLVTVGTAANRFEVKTSTPGDGRGNNIVEVQTAVTKDKIAPKGKLKIPKQSLEKVLAKGLKLTVKCNEACLAKIQVSGKKPKLKKAGKGVAELGKAGKRTLKVKIKGKARKVLSNLSSAKIQVKATFVDEAGNKKTLKKTVVLK